MGFLSNIVNKVVNASKPIFKFENNHLFFKLDNDANYFSYELDNYDLKTRHSSFVSKAYTLQNQDIFLEYINLNNNSIWEGEPLSVFEGFFKEKLNIKYFKTLEDKEIKNYVFKTKRVDDSFVLHLINIYTANSNTIIVDTKGNLYKELLSKLDSNYQYSFDKEEKGSVNFNISIVKENAINSYFKSDKD